MILLAWTLTIIAAVMMYMDISRNYKGEMEVDEYDNFKLVGGYIVIFGGALHVANLAIYFFGG